MVHRITGLIFCALFVAYGVLAQDIQLDFWAEEELFNARTFPTAIASGGALVAALFAVFPGQSSFELESGKTGQVLLLVTAMLIYGLVLDQIGFLLSTSGFLMLGFVVLGERRPLQIIVTGAGLTLGFYALMTSLGIYLETGLAG